MIENTLFLILYRYNRVLCSYLCLRNKHEQPPTRPQEPTHVKVLFNKTKQFVFDFEAICVIGQMVVSLLQPICLVWALKKPSSLWLLAVSHSANSMAAAL
ncbi:unnamed protein product [Citrullus colocynthis]|uniref:Uncharacterized protein n=1 Tax=Citrullus colocynthis TaxID=252529 RepID=A0ABP0YB19_9ROSI